MRPLLQKINENNTNIKSFKVSKVNLVPLSTKNEKFKGKVYGSSWFDLSRDYLCVNFLEEEIVFKITYSNIKEFKCEENKEEIEV